MSRSLITLSAILILVCCTTSAPAQFNLGNQPTSRIEVGFRALDRPTERDVTVVAQDAISLQTLVNGERIGDLNVGNGGDVAYVFQGARGNQFEFRASFAEWDDGVAIGGGNILSPFAPGFTFDNFSTDYDSDMVSIEFNRRQDIGAGFTMLYGVRYISLDEELNILGNFDAGFFDVNITQSISADNPMIGAQVGGEGRIQLLNGIFLQATGRAGVYSNNSSQQIVIDSNVTAPTITSGSNAAVALMGEYSIKLSYDIVPNMVAFYLGYDGIYFSEVAIAPQQAGLVGGTNLDTAFMHGVSLGLRITR